MKSTFVVCLFALCIAASWAMSLQETKTQFLEFQRKYNRTYGSQEEFTARFQIFQANMAKAEKLQQQNPRARFGVTKFSDMSEEEFSRFKMPKGLFKDYVAPPAKTDFSGPRHARLTRLALADPDPTNYDWSSSGCVTPIYNQGQCGSCWAFSATETVESYNCLAGNQLTSLSMEQIVDCDTNGNDQGCNGGFPSGAYSYIQQAGGLEDYNDYPYSAGNGESGSCSYNQQDDVCTVSNYQSISGEDGLYSQLSSGSGGPISVCVDASSWSSYQGGVLTSCGSDVDHCVQLTGYASYGQDGAYWNVRNSWGTDWGENGFIWLAIGQDLCDIGDYATVVQTSSS